MLISHASASRPICTDCEKPFHGTSMIATSTACFSKKGRYCRTDTRLSHEARRVEGDCLICSSAPGSQLSYSIHCLSYFSSSLAMRRTASVRELELRAEHSPA